MDTYSVAPPSDGYDYVNTDPNSPYYMWDYKIGSTAHGEVEHVYGDGRTDWVPASSAKISAASWTPPAGATPLTIETGSIPGAPIIHFPSTSPPTYGSTGGTPAPSTPVASPPASPPASPAPSSGSDPGEAAKIMQGIETNEQAIEKEINAQASSGDPAQIVTAEKHIQQQVGSLQNQIYEAYQAGGLDQETMQKLQLTTVNLGMQGIQQEVNSLEKQGGVTPDEQSGVQAQYTELSSNIQTLEARGALTPGMQGDLNNAMTNLDAKINALQTSSGATPSPQDPVTLGGGSTGTQSGNDNNNDNGSSSSGTTTTGSNTDPTTPQTDAAVVGSTAAPSSDSAAVSGATYTVVHGDTLSGIAESHNISLSQLESLNPQIKNPDLIFPGENVNLGGGGGSTGTTTEPASATGATYTVVHGDTLSGIAAANGISTSQIEALNPQIKDPDLIFPGETVNLGGGATTATPSDSSQTTPAAVTPVSSSSDPSSTLPNLGSTGSGTGDNTNDNSAGGGAIGFPEKSSYPFGTIGAEAEKALGETSANAQAAGWVSGAENESTDIAKQVFEADSHPNTDPLKINDDKNENSGH